MRLHSLELQAFGPYPGREQVDFDHLAGSGLFLLEGPTGAGKSTVLDAVTFALYGELSSERSGKDRLHSAFADPHTTPEVRLELSVRGRRLRITRSPEHVRPRKRGEGTTRQAAAVHLEELRAGAWTSVSSNKAEVGEFVTDLLGLSRAQFTQVVLLPQSEFAQFLRADDDARRALLTKLFGTQLYDRITADLEERRHRAEQARRAAADHISQALAAAAQAAGLDAEGRGELLSLPPHQLAARLDELGAQLATADQQAQVAAALAQDRFEHADRAERLAAARVERLTRAVRAHERLVAHEASRPEHDARVALLDLARRAEPLRPLLAHLEQSAADLAQAEEAFTLVGGDPGALTADEIEGARGAAARDAAIAASLAACAAREDDLPEREALLAATRRELQESTQRAEELATRRAAVPERQQRLQEQQHAAALADAALPALTTALQQLAARVTAAETAVDLAEQVAATRAAWGRARTAAMKADAELVRLVDQRISGMAGELAGRLTAGDPCPVCGSCSHPAPATVSDDVATAADVAAARTRRDEAVETATRRESRLGELLTAQATALALASQDGQPDPQRLRAERDELLAEVAAARAAADRRGELQAAMAALEAERTEVEDGWHRATEAQARLTERSAALRRELDQERAAIDAERAGHPSVRDRIAALPHDVRRDGARARHGAAVRAARAALDTARGAALAEARTRGFPDLAAAAAATLPDDRLHALAAEVSDWDATLRSATDAVADADLADVDVTDLEEARSTLARLRTENEAAEAARIQAGTAARAATSAAAAWSQCLSDVRRARTEQARTLEQTAAVVRLAGLAKGTAGQRRMALTTYVLRHWFAQVVRAANGRLADMSSGRYELERSDEAQTRSGRSGLGLVVVDRYTGGRRHPASLSGGETFFTSLALALGLAEVVSGEAGGIDLDTLFIDEGFGTLDAVTLDQVMEVIDDLRDRGRVIGIVSHVAELKERVPERLEVRRAADGSSRLHVVA